MLDIDAALVEAVLEDWRTAPIEPRLRAVFGLIEKLTLSPDALDSTDIAAARNGGLSDEAIREAAYVVYLFSVMDRLADAFDFTIPTDKGLKANGRFLHKFGYRLAKLIR